MSRMLQRERDHGGAGSRSCRVRPVSSGPPSWPRPSARRSSATPTTWRTRSPFVLLDLLITGVPSSVGGAVDRPAAEARPRRGAAYEQRLLTVAAFGLTAVAVIAVLCAKPLVLLYADKLSPRASRRP